MRFLLVLLVTIISNIAMAQFPYVPDEIKRELSIKEMKIDGKRMSYGISYPENYDPSKKYRALLCLTGGNFSEQLAYYYYHVYSPRESFRDFIKVYPISPNHKTLLSFGHSDWQDLIESLTKNEPLSEKGWVISGASNGGVATYDLISASPKTFDGFITIPGSMHGQQLLEEWKNYKALIVYMSLDHGWISGSKQAYSRLKGHIKAIDIFEIEGYGHILPETYDIEPIYRLYLGL